MKIRPIHLLLGLSLTIPLILVQCKGRQSKVRELEWPPDLSVAVEKAATVPYCDLVRNPARFNNMIVRTEALFQKNLENSFFSDETCKESFTWVEFDPAYVYSDDALKSRFAELTCLKQTRCDGRARISAVGRFEGPDETGYGHLGCCRYRFSIMRIEKAEAVPASTPRP